jgi:N-acetylated-alpha-linked acidic dipeptidase
MRGRIALAVLGLLTIAGAAQRAGDRPFGFARAALAGQAALERRLLSLPDPTRIRQHQLTSQPHPAGSPRDRELADWIADRFRESGMQDVRIVTHDVLLAKAAGVSVEMISPVPWRAPMREPPAAGDADTNVDAAAAGIPFHAYSASGDVTAPVVYAGSGTPAEYEWLASQGIGVRGRIVLVRQSPPYNYRGFKALMAEQRGAAGVLMFSEPAVDNTSQRQRYPLGPWAPETQIERGAILYDFLVPGDPLTPGWASIEGARRIPRAGAVSLPKILSAPLSAADARPILEALGGPAVPPSWRSSQPIVHRAGPGAVRVRLRVRSSEETRPIWTVTGMFPGRQLPDDLIVVGNHRDAWVFGGVDPSSGTAALVELALAYGALTRTGWRPKRSILFASWDAEELALTSSTEWAEQHEPWLRDRGVAYINVDSAASGSRFTASAVPSLVRLVAEAAQQVRDPAAGRPIAAIARERHAAESGRSGDGADSFVQNRLGGGSDYVPFLNHLGMPAANLTFDGPYGVYHSIYDTHAWVERFGDPGFRYHAALVQIWGLVTLRLSEADVLPLDPAGTSTAIDTFVRELDRRFASSPRAESTASRAAIEDLRRAVQELERAAAEFNRARQSALDAGTPGAFARFDRALRTFERSFLDPEGLQGRPWYRHLVHAPRFSYEPDVLPGLGDAIDRQDAHRVSAEAARVAAAVRRAAARLAMTN